MYGRWTLTWALALLISAPSFSFAQDADKATPEKSADANADAAKKKAPEPKAEEESSEEETSEEKKDEATPEEATPAEPEATEAEAAEPEATAAAPAEEAPVVEEAPAEEVKEAPAADVATEATEATQATTDDGKAAVDAMKKDDAKKDEASASTASSGAASATSEPTKEDGKKSKAAAAATLGAAMAVDPSKPWIINATFEQTLGQAAFVKDPNLGRVPYGYALVVGGSYDITKLLEGTLRATARISADQPLTTTAQDLGVRPRQFFLRDLNVGLSGLGIYTEKVTGIRFNGRVGALLPTSQQSQAMQRYLALSVGGTAIKTFADLGPGNLTLVAAESFQKNVGPQKPTTNKAFCDSASRDAALDCYSSLTNASYSFFHTLNAIYGIGSFNVSVGLTLINSVIYDISDSVSGNGQREPTGVGIGANPGATNYASTTWATVSATYVINSNFSVSGGWATVQSPFVQSGNNPRALRFPFWDFQDPSYNGTSFFLDVNFLY